jgi:phospholipase C
MERRLWPARSMRSRPIPTFGRRLSFNYDENDGLFDHVAPPVPPEGTPHEFVEGFPIGGGFRVPCIIVSPWTEGGWVCSQWFDHTSVFQFLEAFTGITGKLLAT